MCLFLGVDTTKSQWSECNSQVHLDLTNDWMTDCSVYVPDLLAAGYQVLVYSGKEDFICKYRKQHMGMDEGYSVSCGNESQSSGDACVCTL